MGPPASPHIVDVLIADRLGPLMRSRAWPLIRPVLYALLDYKKARKLADDLAPLSGEQAVAHVSRMLSLQLEVTGLEHVPAHGRLLIVATHPTGPSDGIAIFDALAPVRRDLHFYANSETLLFAPGLEGTVIGIEWRPERRTREQARAAVVQTRALFERGHALFIFPSGRLSRRTKRGLADWPWQRSALALSRKHDAPVLPIYLSGPRTRWVEVLGRLFPAVKDVTLFHEFLNTRGKRFKVVIGPVIPRAALEGDELETTEALQRYVETVLPSDAGAAFSMS